MRPIFIISQDEQLPTAALEFGKQLAIDMEIEVKLITPFSVSDSETDAITCSDLSLLSDLIEEYDAAMVIYELNNNNRIQYFLNLSRSFRIPYLFVKPNQMPIFNNVGIPVTFLEEEKEKAPFAAAFGRFCHANLTLVQPKDYGTKAQTNINAIKGLFDTFDLNYKIVQGTKDSFKLEQQVVRQFNSFPFDMVIISASREYGLDDIIFGSKEKKILKIAQIPILVINPRADLYALCD